MSHVLRIFRQLSRNETYYIKFTLAIGMFCRYFAYYMTFFNSSMHRWSVPLPSQPFGDVVPLNIINALIYQDIHESKRAGLLYGTPSALIHLNLQNSEDKDKIWSRMAVRDSVPSNIFKGSITIQPPNT